MLRALRIWMATAISLLVVVPVRAHELWFQPFGEHAAAVRLTFGDSPAPGEAERVAEIAHAKVWGDGAPLEVKRLADGLEACVPKSRPAVLSAYADRGVVDYQGDSFVIYLAAYAQSVPIRSPDALRLGLGDDQLRLLLVADDGGLSHVRATWRGKPAADVGIQVFRGSDSTEVRTDAHGEIPCPGVSTNPVSLLAVLIDKTPGTRDGKSFSHTRYKATLALGCKADYSPNVASVTACLARVKEIHGAAGPWAVAGYRMGARALKESALPRHSFALSIVHHCPAQVQYSCMADGLQAATGASLGKLNLTVKEASTDALKTVVADREKGRYLSFVLKPDLVASIRDLRPDRLAEEGRRIAALPDDKIFTVTETVGEAK